MVLIKKKEAKKLKQRILYAWDVHDALDKLKIPANENLSERLMLFSKQLLQTYEYLQVQAENKDLFLTNEQERKLFAVREEILNFRYVVADYVEYDSRGKVLWEIADMKEFIILTAKIYDIDKATFRQLYKKVNSNL